MTARLAWRVVLLALTFPVAIALTSALDVGVLGILAVSLSVMLATLIAVVLAIRWALLGKGAKSLSSAILALCIAGSIFVSRPLALLDDYLQFLALQGHYLAEIKAPLQAGEPQTHVFVLA